MKLTVAVTGATGFVGKAVVPQLLAAGYAVRVLVRDHAQFDPASNAQIVRGDLEDASALFELASGADVVLHMAGAITAVNRRSFFKTNEAGTRAVAMAAEAGGVKRFVLLSSLAARRPDISAYAASKQAAEMVVDNLRSHMQVMILRPAAVYGPRDKATLPLLKALMGRIALLPGRSGNRFSLIHVDDLARVCVAAVSSAEVGLREIDDASGGHNWAELAAITKANFKRPERVMFLPYGLALLAGALGDLASKVMGKPAMISIGKMRELYEPDWLIKGKNWPRKNSVSLLDGLPQTIAWYQAQGLLPQGSNVDTRPPETSSAKHDN